MRNGLLAALLVTSSLFADGMMIPVDRERPQPQVQRIQHFEVKYHYVTVNITDQFANVEIEQAFKNPSNFMVEADYIFPLPDYAAIQKLGLWINGKETPAELLDADQARKIYEDIVRRYRDPALLEYYGYKMYRQRVFPFQPLEERKMKLAFSHPVQMDGGLCQFRYQLNTEKFSAAPLDQCRILVNLKCTNALKNITSPTHNIDVVRKSDTEAVISFEANKVKPDTDFVLYYSYDDKDIGVNVLTNRRTGEDGFFVAFVSPKTNITTAQLPKDVIFVVDTSGSMAGDKIRQARQALEHCVNKLGENDRFNIVTFATAVNPLFTKLTEVNKGSVAEARDVISKIQATGGTNIEGALTAALEMFSTDDDRPGYIIFATDGIPTLGLKEDVPLAKKITEMNKKNKRVFVFGVGNDLNTVLLSKMAADNRGLIDYVAPEENLEIKISAFADKIGSPVLQDPQLEVTGARVFDIFPVHLPDLFKGQQMVVYGKYSGTGEVNFKITGKYGKQQYSTSTGVKIVDQNGANEYIPLLWATVKINYLLDQMRQNGESKEVKDEIVTLAKKYGIVTPYTSFLVLEDIPNATPGIRRALGGRTGFAEDAARAKGGFDKKEGKDSVEAAKTLAENYQSGQNVQKMREQLSKEANMLVRNVGQSAFYNDQGKWIESTVKKEANKKIKFMSDEYLTLARKSQHLREILAQGANIVFEDGSDIIEITE